VCRSLRRSTLIAPRPSNAPLPGTPVYPVVGCAFF